ncbi:MAG: hypothetical protein H0S78_11140 [Tissierellales bacterium]|jgi:hypothetical protein|nr:hypothetical protein [Tissierellales bacterium]
MKILKVIMLVIGITAFIFGAYNIVVLKIPNQWFGFISGAFLIWLFFNIDNFIKKDECSKEI